MATPVYLVRYKENNIVSFAGTEKDKAIQHADDLYNRGRAAAYVEEWYGDTIAQSTPYDHGQIYQTPD